jgi:hypothetical protein
MNDRDDALPIKALIAVAIFAIGLCWYTSSTIQECSFVCCGVGEVGHTKTQSEYDEVHDEAHHETGRAIRKIWFSPGAPIGLTQTDFQSRIMAELSRLSLVTNTDFIKSESAGGAYLRIYVATDAMMRQKWKDPQGLNRVPLGLQSGNWIYVTMRDRWGKPEQRLVEGMVLHEFGHRVGLKHSTDSTSIMNANLTTTHLNSSDIAAFQKRLGKPK